MVPLRVDTQIGPLTDTDIARINKAIQPQFDKTGKMHSCGKVFRGRTAYRNWLMFQYALQLGLRKGEMLKLKMSDLPRGLDRVIAIRRHPDDPRDSRRHEPNVKTSERLLPLTDDLLAATKLYLTGGPPFGRVDCHSPYLFVTQAGAPVSISTANKVIRQISVACEVKCSWHPLRHTFFDALSERLYDENHGDPLTILKDAGGWKSDDSPRRYTERSRRKRSLQLLARRTKDLFKRVEQ